MENDDKKGKEILFLEPYNSEMSEEETVKKLAKILKKLGFKIIDEEDN